MIFVLFVFFVFLKTSPRLAAQKDNKSYVLNANNGKVVKEFNCNRFTFNDTSTFAYSSDNDSNKIHIYNLNNNYLNINKNYYHYMLNN